MIGEGVVNNLVLDVDLTTGSIQETRVSEDDRRQFLGGKGLALKLICDRIRPGIDPLSQDNILGIMSGPTSLTASPAGGRFAVVSKSPLTGLFASSMIGGRFGGTLKRAGFDGILIRGRAEAPKYLRIDESVSIENAESLWGMDTLSLQESRKEEGDWIVIGPAGENRVRYSVLASGNRVAGRCGFGAVLGAKNLKGIVAKGRRGRGKFKPADPRRFDRAIKTARKKIRSHHITGTNLPQLGTPQNIMIFGLAGCTPVRNFSKSRFQAIEKLSGERIREKHFIKNHGCLGCLIQCGRTGKFSDQKLVSPEYETIALMGSNLEIDDLNVIARWNEKLHRLGMDTITTGNVIGFVMELNERGMLDANLSFASPDGIDQMIEDIAQRRGLGKDLAEGVRSLSEKYGGRDFAIQVKGLEMPAYDPRGCTGQGLGYATANHGATHLSGSTHAIEVGSILAQHGIRGKSHWVKFFQDLGDFVDSAVFCVQTEYPFLQESFTYKYTPMPLKRFISQRLPGFAIATTDMSDYAALISGLMGEKFSKKDLLTIGERIFTLNRLMNCREGITRSDDTLPERILKEVREDSFPPIELDKMLAKYYSLRKWDSDGKPSTALLERLDLAVTPPEAE
jgi:aldehyde:ferredoxin oxidoreductase